MAERAGAHGAGPGLTHLEYDEIMFSCDSFPNHMGLGWDRWHPKVLKRASKQLVLMLIDILLECEAKGQWPEGVALVLIALLTKGDGDFRLI